MIVFTPLVDCLNVMCSSSHRGLFLSPILLAVCSPRAELRWSDEGPAEGTEEQSGSVVNGRPFGGQTRLTESPESPQGASPSACVGTPKLKGSETNRACRLSVFGRSRGADAGSRRTAIPHTEVPATYT